MAVIALMGKVINILDVCVFLCRCVDMCSHIEIKSAIFKRKDT